MPYDKKIRSALTTQKYKWDATLPEMEVPKLTPTTVEDWHTAFTTVIGKQTGLSGISLDYLLRSNSFGDYNLNWPTREEKLHNCISLTGQRFKTDSKSLDSLLVQHIGTCRCGSDSITKYKPSKNGRTCHLEIKSHFYNSTHLQNLATSSNRSLDKAQYYVKRRTLTIETYYDIMSHSFNNLSQAGNNTH